jgi:hypothetical protein
MVRPSARGYLVQTGTGSLLCCACCRTIQAANVVVFIWIMYLLCHAVLGEAVLYMSRSKPHECVP